MVQNIQTRFNDFKVELQIKRIALNFDQVQEYKLPENYVKIKDTRAKDYIERYGKKCYEVDALRPDILDQLIRQETEALIDMNIFRSRTNNEKEFVRKLQYIAENIKHVEGEI